MNITVFFVRVWEVQCRGINTEYYSVYCEGLDGEQYREERILNITVSVMRTWGGKYTGFNDGCSKLWS